MVIPVDDYAAGWREALAAFKAQIDDLMLGRQPRPNRFIEATDQDRKRLKDVINYFLQDKRDKLDAGKISPRSFEDYKSSGERLAAVVGKDRSADDLRPDDFTNLHRELQKKYGPVRLGNEVQRVRSIFRYAAEQEWIEKVPNFGAAFRRPGGREMRLHRAKSGKRAFEPGDLRQMIGAAGVPLKAIVLLGINAALGNSEIGRLRRSNLDLDNGWLDFHREKTGVSRRARAGRAPFVAQHFASSVSNSANRRM